MEKLLIGAGTRKFAVSVHLVLCVVTGFIAYLFINIYVKNFTHADNEEIAFMGTVFFIGSVYAGRFLAQLWIPKNKKVPAALMVLLSLIITAGIFICIQFAGSLLQHREAIYVAFLVFPFFIMSLATGMLVKLVRTRINHQLQEAQANAAHSQSELHLLQSQLSPHFLFNTLNNMYGISITEHKKIPGLLLKLAELLRYSVYDTKQLFVPLKEELDYINNYIGFETIRLGERLVLTTDIETVTDIHYKIAPMLLVVFVENAFKHAKNTADQKIFVDIAVKIWNGSVLFSLKNSYREHIEKVAGPHTNSGLGLPNVLKRLTLLYPDEFDLKHSKDENTYSVMLRLAIRK